MPVPTPATTAAPTRARRVTLSTTSRSAPRLLPKIVIYSEEGVGKTSFAAGAVLDGVAVEARDDVFFIDVEESTLRIRVNRATRDDGLPPQDLDDVHDALDALDADGHQFRWVAIDTIDALEKLIIDAVCKQHGVDNIEAFGYGKGYTIIADEVRRILAKLERLRRRGLGVIILGHADIKVRHDPTVDDYDRWQLRLGKQAAALVREWAEVVGFAAHEIVTERDDGARRARGTLTGARMLYLNAQAGFHAKTRAGLPLPAEVPLEWSKFSDALEAAMREEDAAVARLLERGRGLNAKDRATFEKNIKQCAGDAARLKKAEEWLNEKLGAADGAGRSE